MKRGKRPQDKEGALLPKRGVVALATEGFNLSHPLYRPPSGKVAKRTKVSFDERGLSLTDFRTIFRTYYEMPY